MEEIPTMTMVILEAIWEVGMMEVVSKGYSYIYSCHRVKSLGSFPRSIPLDEEQYMCTCYAE